MILSIDLTSAITPIQENGVDLYIRNSANNAMTLSPVYDTEGQLVSDFLITYTVTTPEGNTLSALDIPLDLTNPVYLFPIDEIGTYNIVLQALYIPDGSITTAINSFESVNSITFEYTACNTYTVYNRVPNETITIEVDILDSNGITNNEILPFDVATGESFEFTLNAVSIYIATITYGNNITEEYVIANYCSVDECISNYILDILCEDTRLCKECPPETDLNQILLLSYTLFMKLNEEYSIANFYTGLTQTQLDSLATISKVMERLENFCSRRNCNPNFPNRHIYTPDTHCSTCN